MDDATSTPLAGPPAYGQDVIDLQCALAAAGMFDGDIDGAFGPATSKAITMLERSHGLSPTGILTAESAKILNWRKAKPVASMLPAVTTGLAVRIFNDAVRPHIEINLPHVSNALAETGLVDRPMIAMALATIRVETSSFLPISELPSAFNTSPGGKPFDLYDQRIALGNLGAPDGSRFRGRGFVQLTGRANYAQFSRILDLETELVGNPYLAHDSAISARILAAFLKAKENHIRVALRDGRLDKARRLVNGGSNGLAAFVAAYQLALQLLPQQLRPAA